MVITRVHHSRLLNICKYLARRSLLAPAVAINQSTTSPQHPALRSTTPKQRPVLVDHMSSSSHSQIRHVQQLISALRSACPSPQANLRERLVTRGTQTSRSMQTGSFLLDPSRTVSESTPSRHLDAAGSSDLASWYSKQKSCNSYARRLCKT